MKKEIKKNLINIFSLILAMIALFLSYQANKIARQNSEPNVKILFDTNSSVVSIEGCKADSNTYTLSYIFTHPLIMSNTGGRNISITSISLRRGDEHYFANFYRGNNANSFNNVPLYILPRDYRIQPPINLEVGASLDIYLQADVGIAYADKDYAQTELSTSLENKQKLTWEITLSDGTNIVLEKEPSYEVSVDFDQICKNN